MKEVIKISVQTVGYSQCSSFSIVLRSCLLILNAKALQGYRTVSQLEQAAISAVLTYGKA